MRSITGCLTFNYTCTFHNRTFGSCHSVCLSVVPATQREYLYVCVCVSDKLVEHKNSAQFFCRVSRTGRPTTATFPAPSALLVAKAGRTEHAHDMRLVRYRTHKFTSLILSRTLHESSRDSGKDTGQKNTEHQSNTANYRAFTIHVCCIYVRNCTTF